MAVNKIDKPDANPQRVMQELLQHDVQVEEFGGDTLCVAGLRDRAREPRQAARSDRAAGRALDLAADPDRNAEGTVIEARLDRGRGPVATVLVQRGTLQRRRRSSSPARNGAACARCINDKGENIVEATPSTPVEVLGFSGAPEAGDRVAVVESEARAREITEYRERQRREKLAARGRRVARARSAT